MKNRAAEHRIKEVLPGSIAQEMELAPGDVLLEINGQPVEDVFDYQYLINDEELYVLVRKPDGEEWELEIGKEPEEDLGIVFENSLMDEYHSCRNKCIFCFIDQMPPGMRDTLYFKDDDSRLSFLQGNYVTLTNMSGHDIERIIRYHLEPINISFHTMNPQLRCRMLNNRFAGDIFPKVQALADAGIEMNGQIVLCRGINDGAELEHSIEKLTAYLPALRSVSVVPVGLTRFREGLYPLEPFTAQDAQKVIDSIEAWQRKLYPVYGLHFVHASDEWYILAGRELPEEERYDGYLQLENGVGMMRLLYEEVMEELSGTAEKGQETADGDAMRVEPLQEAAVEELSGTAEKGQETADGDAMRVEPLQEAAVEELSGTAEKGQAAAHEDAAGPSRCVRGAQEMPREISIATGRIAAPLIRRLCGRIRERFPQLTVRIYEIRNLFFGEQITVSGLITGRDLLEQLSGQDLGEELLLPVNMLRSGEQVFLDDVTVEELEKALQIRIRIVKSSGHDFVAAVTGREQEPPEEDAYE